MIEAAKLAPFERTSCACDQCVSCCKRQPGPLAPGDFEAIAAHLGEDRETAKEHFCASPGATVIQNGRVRRIGSIAPKTQPGTTRWVFLDENDRCRIHPVAPMGCSFFDMHMDWPEGQRRSNYVVQAQDADEDYKALRNELPLATSHLPRTRI